MSDTQTPSATDEMVALDRAEQALKTGHFAAARKLLSQPLPPSTPELAERRKALWNRMSPDKMIPILLGICLLLFIAIVASTAH